MGLALAMFDKGKTTPFNSSQPKNTIRTGIWGLLFTILYFLLLPFMMLTSQFSIFCFPFVFILTAFLAVLLTFFLWLFWTLLRIIRPAPGLNICHELGKFELNETWEFTRYLIRRNFGLDLTSSSPHIMIVGGSQTGKSVTMKTILVKLLNEKERGNIILDYHGEYGFLKEKGFTVIDARHYDPLAQNYSNEQKEHIVDDFVEAFLVAYETVGDVQLAILKNRLQDYSTLPEALSSIENDAESAKSFTERDRLVGLFLRLEKVVRYANGKNTLSQLTSKSRNIVFDFSGIRDRDAADFYAENILRRYMALLVEAGKPVNIFIDEAHRLNTKSLQDRGCTTTTVRIAREAGKFGGRLIIASQNLTDFPSGFSANFGNIMSFRIPTGSDIQVLEHLTGIGAGKLQAVMNGLRKGEALLIGPQDRYSLIKVSMPGKFPKPDPKAKTYLEEEPLQPPQPEPAPDSPPIAIGVPDERKHPSTCPTTPRTSRKQEILKVLKENGALTVTGLALRTGYPKPAVWRHLQTLAKKGKIIRYEEVETLQGLEVFYEINDPHRAESSFHRILVAKAYEELERVGKVKILNEWGMPDLLFNDIVAIEVETGLKLNLEKFRKQVVRRFDENYMKVIVVVNNQKQKMRYEAALQGINKVFVKKYSELANLFK